MADQLKNFNLVARHRISGLGMATNLFFLVAIASVPPTDSLAQQTLSAPNPIRSIVGPHGVNVVTRGVHINEVDLLVGPDDAQSSLRLTRSLVSGGTYYISPSTSMGNLGVDGYFSHNFHIEVKNLYRINNIGVSGISLIYQGKLYNFAPSSTQVLTDNVYDDGSSFRYIGVVNGYPNFELRTKDGTKVFFEKSIDYIGDEYGSILARYIEYPNGEFIVLKYDATSLPYPSLLSQYAGAPDVTHRLASVQNSRGYGMRFSYVNSGTLGSRDVGKLTLSGVQLFSRSCVQAGQCAEVMGPAVGYSYEGRSRNGQTLYFLRTVSRPDGTVSKYGDDNLETITVSDGNDSTTDYSYYALHDYVQYGQDDVDVGALVQHVTDSRGRRTWFRGGSGVGGAAVELPDGTVTTYGSDYQRTYTYYGANEPHITSIQDGLGNTTTFAYDGQNGNLLSATYPEGDQVLQAWDSRSNIVEVRRKAKPGTGLADTVTTWSYPDCTDSNYRYCNSPSHEIDARGNRTDYQYDPVSGQLALQVLPPDESGLRAAIRFRYEAFAPADSAAFPTGFGVPSTWLRVAEDRCLSSSLTASTQTLAFSCPASDLVETRYLYQASSPSAPTKHLQVGVERRFGAIQELTCFGYDPFGRKVSETSPGSGLTACP